MAKTFGSLKVGDTVYLSIKKGFYDDNNVWVPFGSTKLSHYHYLSEGYAIVTNVETYGDEVIVSYKNNFINHTVKAPKIDTYTTHFGPVRYGNCNNGYPRSKNYWYWCYTIETTQN